MVSASHWLRCMETYAFLWSLILASANQASSKIHQLPASIEIPVEIRGCFFDFYCLYSSQEVTANREFKQNISPSLFLNKKSNENFTHFKSFSPLKIIVKPQQRKCQNRWKFPYLGALTRRKK